MSDESKPRRRVPASVWILLLAWVVATGAAAYLVVPREERDLANRAGAAVAGSGVTVDVAGRDVALSGSVEAQSDIDLAAASVRQVRGVRRVDSSALAVAAPSTSAPPAPTPPTISVEVVAGRVTLQGTVPNAESADAVVAIASDRWGAENVTDLLVVDGSTAGAAWLAGIVPAIESMSELTDGRVEIGPAGVLVTGMVPSDEMRSTIEQGLAGAFGPDVPIENRLDVVALQQPEFHAEMFEAGTVRLSGVLPDRDIFDRIVAAAAGVYGSANVINEMSLGSGVARPDYLEALPGTFGAIDGILPWEVSVENGAAAISGLAVSDTALDETLAALAGQYEPRGLPLSSDLSVDPNAVATVLTELLKGTATFEIGSSQLSTEATVLLDEAIEILQANPTTVLAVEGHTDDVGSEEDNQALSEARAQAVVDYLVAGGVDAARLTAVGYGESRPIADNSTAEGRAENRRIEFVVEGGNG